MRLVYDDGEIAFPVLRANLLQNEGELLDSRNNDLLSTLDELAKVSSVLRVSDRCPNLSKLLDGVPNLLVEDAPIRDNNDRIKYRGIIPLKADKLMREPSDGIRLSAPRRMLNQVSISSAVLLNVIQQLSHNI